MDEDDRIIFLENNISSILRISQSSDQYNKFHFSILHSKEVISFLDDPRFEFDFFYVSTI